MHIETRTAVKILIINAWALLLILALAYVDGVRKEHLFDVYMVKGGQEYGVDPRLLSAVIWKESRFDPKATGKAGERGLMQLMEGTAQDWAKENNIAHFNPQDLYNPQTNILAGAWYLGKALDDWKEKSDPMPYVLAQYNAGPSRAQNWDKIAHDSPQDFWENIPIQSTKKYVKDILIRYRGHL